MYKTLAVYYGGIFLVIMALNLHGFLATRNTTKTSQNHDTHSSIEPSSQGSQLGNQRGSGRGGV